MNLTVHIQSLSFPNLGFMRLALVFGLLSSLLFASGCSDEDKDPPVLTLVKGLGSIVYTLEPDIVINSSEDGQLRLQWPYKCKSSHLTIKQGENTIKMDPMMKGKFTDCSLIVTDKVGNPSSVLKLPPFEIKDKFVKLNSKGEPLADQSKVWNAEGSEEASDQWSCVHNITSGLVWEVKTDDEGLRDKDWYYMNTTAHNTDNPWDPITDGSFDHGFCAADSIPEDGIFCDTEKYVDSVNEENLCGVNDWRMPTGNGEKLGDMVEQELQGLLTCRFNCEKGAPLIDTHFFPHAAKATYWSASPSQKNGRKAWAVNFGSAKQFQSNKDQSLFIRLVRHSL